jgi:hypothetical protein
MSERWSVQASGFFVPVPEWLEESEVSDKGLRLWVRLYRYAQKHQGDGKEITREEIAQLVGWSLSTTDRELKGLEELAALRVSRYYDATTKRYANNTYTVLVERPEVAEPVVKSDERSRSDDDGRLPWSEPVVSPDERSEPVVSPDDASSTKKKEPTTTGRRRSASSSPRSVPPEAERVNGQRTTGLTPGTEPQSSAAATSSDKHAAEARRIADHLAQHGASVTDVRRMVAALKPYLAKGMKPEDLQAAALPLYTVTEGTLGVALQNAERGSNGRPRRPAPEYVDQTEREPAMTPEEKAAAAVVRERVVAEQRARRAARLKAQQAEREETLSRTLRSPAEEVAG